MSASTTALVGLLQAERQEAARRAEEERQRVQREAVAPSHTVEDLERMRAALAAQIAQRQHHLKVDAEQEAMRHRAERLQADIEAARTKLAALEAEHAVLVEKLTGLVIDSTQPRVGRSPPRQ